MKKLTVALVLVALLTLPMVGLAGPPSDNPPQGNDGLINARPHTYAAWMSPGNGWFAMSVIIWLIEFGAPPIPGGYY